MPSDVLKVLRDFTLFLWLLKLGTVVNLWLLAHMLVSPGSAADSHLLSTLSVCSTPIGWDGWTPSPG
jgi:hypothetical protein